MAKFSQEDTVQSNQCPLPKDRYRVRIIGTATGKSSSGKPMTTLTGEIIDPEIVHVDGVEYRIAGRQFKMYLMHVNGESWGQSKVFAFMDKLGIDHGGEYDTELHKEYFHGREFDIVLDSKEQVKRYPAQPGEKQGKPILDGQGKEISNGWQIQADIGDVPDYCAPGINEAVASQPY